MCYDKRFQLYTWQALYANRIWKLKYELEQDCSYRWDPTAVYVFLPKVLFPATLHCEFLYLKTFNYFWCLWSPAILSNWPKNLKGGYKVMFLKVCICSKMDLLLKNANTFIIIIQIICLQETLYHGASSALKKYSFDFNESSSNLYSSSTVHQHLSFKIDSPTILNHSEW